MKEPCRDVFLVFFAAVVIFMPAVMGKLQLLKNITINCQELTCAETGLLKLNFSQHDRNLVGFDLLDSVNRIAMEWTPKSACTASVKMFMDHMGQRENEHYKGWVHEFRRVYYAQCGWGNTCIYEDPSWYKFKVVRNPWDRAVSSFIHIMKTPNAVEESQLVGLIKGVTMKDQITFQNFLFAMDLMRDRDPLLKNGHIRKQSLDLEFELYKAKKPPLFNRIVQLEHMNEHMALVNNETGANFQTGFKSDHYYPRNENATEFVGRMPWRKLKDRVPANYGHFYNDKLKERVHKLFRVDILLYNYSFPF